MSDTEVGSEVDELVSAFQNGWCAIDHLSDYSSENDSASQSPRVSRKKERKKLHKRKPGEKQEKRQRKILEKRAKRLEQSSKLDFNPRNVGKKLSHFIEHEDSDYFTFPQIPNAGGTSRIAYKLLARLAQVFDMKVSRLHKMKKLVILAGVRTPKTPIFVSEEHRKQLNEIYKSWEQMKSGADVTKEAATTSKTKRKKIKTVKAIPFVQSETIDFEKDEVQVQTADNSSLASSSSASSAKSAKQLSTMQLDGRNDSSEDFGSFENYTKGFGSKMLAKMGFSEGSGLGKDNQGIRNPLKAEKRKKKLGLGA